MTNEGEQMVVIDRHSGLVRLTHWVNATSFLFLLVSGAGILVALPAFYWGETGYWGMEAWITLGFEPNPNHTAWGRNYHFLFAWVFMINGLIYIVSNLISGHFWQKVIPTRTQWAPGHILADIMDHIRLRTPKGEAARDYNFLQKISYIVVIFILCPLMLLSGLTMSPAITTAFPELFTLFGGRHSARTIHFICASLLLSFFIIHIVQVILAGARNEIRSMISGKYILPKEDK